MKAAVKAALERQHARRRAIYDEWRSLQPCKNGSVSVAADGSCLRCGADQGVHGYACDFDRKNEGDGTHPNQVGPWS